MIMDTQCTWRFPALPAPPAPEPPAHKWRFPGSVELITGTGAVSQLAMFHHSCRGSTPTYGGKLTMLIPPNTSSNNKPPIFRQFIPPIYGKFGEGGSYCFTNIRNPNCTPKNNSMTSPTMFQGHQRCAQERRHGVSAQLRLWTYRNLAKELKGLTSVASGVFHTWMYNYIQ